MTYFWKKKTIVSFVLTVFVLWIHISSFGQYLLTADQESYSALGTFVRYLSVFFTDTFVRMAVPLFFILSGAATFRNYDNKKYVSKLKSRAWSLLFPYLIWNTVGMLFAIVTSYTSVSQFFLAREKFVLTVPNVLKAIFFYECNGPFWFICTLIVFIVLSPVFDLLTKTKTTAIISFVVIIIISQFEIPYFSTLIHGTDSMVYYMAGCVLGRHFLKPFTDRSSKRFSVCALCVFVLCTVIWFIRGIGMFELPPSVSAGFLTVYALSLWYAFDIINIESIRLRPFMDDNMFIYALHVNLSAVIVKLLYMLLPKQVLWSIPNFIITTVLTILIILLFAAFLRRFLKPVYLLLSGKKKRSKA